MVPMVYKTVVKEKFITQWRHVVLGRLPDSDPKVDTDESFRRCSSDAKDKKREKNVTFLRSLALEVCFFLELNEGIKWHLCAQKITIITITTTCSSSLSTSLGFSFNTTWCQWYQKSIIIQPLKKTGKNPE